MVEWSKVKLGSTHSIRSQLLAVCEELGLALEIVLGQELGWGPFVLFEPALPVNNQECLIMRYKGGLMATVARKTVKPGKYFVVVCGICKKNPAELKLRKNGLVKLVCRECFDKAKKDKKDETNRLARYIEILKEELPKNDALLHDSIVFLYNKQTKDEMVSSETLWKNSIGFSTFDAKTLSYYAKWILSGKRLTGEHLEKARTRMVKYAAQLAYFTKPSDIHEVVLKYAKKS